jgi:enoyl-CoA hydratase/carnithine racemase
MKAWTIESSEEDAATRILLGGRPSTAADWERSCAELEKRWPLSGRVELEIEGPGEPLTALEGGDPEALIVAAGSLMRRRSRSRALLLARSSGRAAGPWLSLALSADLLLVAEGMAADALFWEDSRLLTPGEMLGVAGRLGRARALEWALAGVPFGASELLERHAALGGEEGRRAWESARAGSLVAQEAAASLMRSREPGRAASETLERTAFTACFDAADRAEGVSAFQQRRQARFPSQRSKTRS